jgi:nitrite reductase/ring-hydroxylating ferredoxin subunit
MADDASVICISSDLEDGGRGVRFQWISQSGVLWPAFALRYQGVVVAYINRCAHVSVELDWIDGEFFDRDKRYLVCSTHGALYRPEDGFCIEGPCQGKRLESITVTEAAGQVLMVKEI